MAFRQKHDLGITLKLGDRMADALAAPALSSSDSDTADSCGKVTTQVK